MTRKAWIENGVVRDVCPGNPAESYHPDIAALYTADVPDGTINGATLIGGEWVNPPPPPLPTPAPADPVRVQADTTVAIQDLLDSTAREHGYDDLRSTISYVGSSVLKWHNEGTRAKQWRDDCWWTAFQIQEAVKAGTRPLPTVEEVLAEMPPANWPAA